MLTYYAGSSCCKNLQVTQGSRYQANCGGESIQGTKSKENFLKNMKIMEIKRLNQGICKCQNTDNKKLNQKQTQKTQGWPWQILLRNICDEVFRTGNLQDCSNLQKLVLPYCVPWQRDPEGFNTTRMWLIIHLFIQNYNLPLNFSVGIPDVR